MRRTRTTRECPLTCAEPALECPCESAGERLEMGRVPPHASGIHRRKLTRPRSAARDPLRTLGPVRNQRLLARYNGHLCSHVGRQVFGHTRHSQNCGLDRGKWPLSKIRMPIVDPLPPYNPPEIRQSRSEEAAT